MYNNNYLNSDERWEEFWLNVVINVEFSDEVSYDVKNENEIPNYLKSKTDNESFGLLKVEEKYKENLELMLKNMIDISEEKTIIFSSQYKENDKEIILGTITIDIFLKKLFDKEILANVYYIISV